MLHLILFFIFAAVCIAGAVNLLAQSHPINSALSLIVVMGSLAVLYLLLGAEFVAAIQIIIYAGAVMVLFIFVIMLLNAGVEEHSGKSYVAWFIGIPSVLALVALAVYSLLQQEKRAASPAVGSDFIGSVEKIAARLFGDFLLPFEVTSVLILIAIMGAVVLARRGES
ncbi:MAG TPA: NADH-quinone oxidoreductase subunit J [Terriglobales bacterium]|jgi:NADH-quinone oxidoreductase subunit J|nr:NADH-quinone oxidoreductase subunit J [Terriglobales bacterium]